MDKKILASRVLSGLVVAFLIYDGGIGLFAPHMLDAEMTATGFPFVLVTGVGIIAWASAALYALPRTALIGAILITGFAGGAICTHYRIGDMGTPPQIVCALLAVAAWGGLWLRDARLRALFGGVAL